MAERIIEGVQIPFKATLPFALSKVNVDAGQRKNIYITLCVSDNLLDLQGDRMDINVLHKIAQLAKEGKIALRRHHDEGFPLAWSVDGEVREEGNRVGVYVTFKAENINFDDQNPDYYPEIKHLVNSFKAGRPIPLEASVGGWITKYSTTLEKGKPVRVILDAEVNHVAFCPPQGAANPRTGVFEVFIKSLSRAIEQFEQQEEPEEILVEVVEESEEPMEGVQMEEKNIWLELEKCRRDRRRLSYTKSDIEELYKRAKQFGISPVPMGNIIKPEIYLEIADEDFADRVNYLFPMRKDYLPATIKFFRENPSYILNIYDFETASKVFSTIVERALKEGIPVRFEGSPADALLPEELASKLGGYNQQVWTLLKTWATTYEKHNIKLVAGLWDEVHKGVSKEVLRKAAAEMENLSKEYGYKPGLNAKLLPAPEFASLQPSQFADPVGKNFPITPEWVGFSYRAFQMPEVQAMYDDNALRVIYGRLLKGLENVGAQIPFNPDNPLDWHYIAYPVFIGTEEYLEDPRRKQAEKALKEKVIQLKKHYVLIKQSDIPVTAGEAPHFPFMLTDIKAYFPSDKPLKVIRVLPHLVTIDKSTEKATGLPMEFLALSELLSRLGVKDGKWDKPKDIKLVWVGGKDAANPIADIEGKEKEGKVHEVGYQVIGNLKVLRKDKTLVDYVIFEDGTVWEISYVNQVLRKDELPFLRLEELLADKIVKAGLADDAVVLMVTPLYVVWEKRLTRETASDFKTYITPVTFKDGQVEVEPVAIEATQAFIPKDADVSQLLVEKLGESAGEGWKEYAQMWLGAAETPEGEIAEEVPVTVHLLEEEGISEEEVEEEKPGKLVVEKSKKLQFVITCPECNKGLAVSAHRTGEHYVEVMGECKHCGKKFKILRFRQRE